MKKVANFVRFVVLIHLYQARTHRRVNTNTMRAYAYTRPEVTFTMTIFVRCVLSKIVKAGKETRDRRSETKKRETYM